MNKEAFVRILTGACKLYKENMDKETMELWLAFFKDNTTEEFKEAMNEHIKTSRFFPTVADIKAKIYEIKTPEETATKLWEKFLGAIGNGSYHAEEEFEKLPAVVQEFVRNPKQLQEFAKMDSEKIHTVVKGQFLKQIETIKANFKENGITGRKNLLEEKGILKIEEVTL